MPIISSKSKVLFTLSTSISFLSSIVRHMRLVTTDKRCTRRCKWLLHTTRRKVVLPSSLRSLRELPEINGELGEVLTSVVLPRRVFMDHNLRGKGRLVTML